MIRFYEVNDSDTLEEIFRFRYDIVVEELGFFDPDMYEGHKERDEWDEYSTHFVALDDECNIVATTRIIHHAPIPYPTEKYMKINEPIRKLLDMKRDSLCEISRLFVAKKYRTMHDTKTIIDGFIKRHVYFTMRRYGLEYAYSAIERRFKRLLKMYNVHFDVIGPEQSGYGSPRLPCLLYVHRLGADNPKLIEYYESKEPWLKKLHSRSCR